ncbi:MAG TPA: FAD-dependent oxidoreductase [Burkholderiales bacterium]|nr:FAD-dependent oxidoreductase [Burkholderiales bacterium]
MERSPADRRGRLLLLIALVALIAAFFAFDFGRYFTLAYFKSQQAAFDAFYRAHPLQTAAVFFLAYVAVAALSLPGAALLTLVAGAIFGLLWGTLIVSFASTIGATLAFLASRFLFREAIQQRFGDRLRAINEGVEREGSFYLFTLRLVPLFPFFVVNLLMGLTPIAVRAFYWVSQVGMLPGTIVYVNAGRQLARIDSLQGILSATLLLSFALLGVFPLIAKRVVDVFKARKVYAGWPRPRRFDRNVVVIGAGSAGLVAAYIAAAVKAKVTLIEKHKMGGDCLNTGCVPSKALLRTAKLAEQMRQAQHWALPSVQPEIDFAAVMTRIRAVIRAIAPHDSVERYTALGVECICGEATILSPWSVAVRTAEGVRTLTTRNIVIATGGQPAVPPISGLKEIGYLTSDTIWDLTTLPRRLLVLGGGPIGCELAQGFARLGARVTVVEMLPRLLMREDPEISALVLQRFRSEGMQVLLEHKAQAFERAGEDKVLIAEHAGKAVRIAFDEVLVAVGRVATTSGYGLEQLGIPLTKQRTLEVNEFMATRFPNIFACGDVAGPYQFTHTAAHTAWYASVNALFGRFRKFRADFSVIPWATFTEPEVARVGLNEIEAKEKGVAYEVATYGIDDLDRAIADGEAYGLVKVLTVPGKDKILGATIVGEHAADLLIEYITAMKHGIGLNKILGTIHIYPTLAEANKYAAGAWKRAHAPQRLLRWVERYHAWMRG